MPSSAYWSSTCGLPAPQKQIRRTTCASCVNKLQGWPDIISRVCMCFACKQVHTGMKFVQPVLVYASKLALAPFEVSILPSRNLREILGIWRVSGSKLLCLKQGKLLLDLLKAYVKRLIHGSGSMSSSPRRLLASDRLQGLKA